MKKIISDGKEIVLEKDTVGLKKYQEKVETFLFTDNFLNAFS